MIKSTLLLLIILNFSLSAYSQSDHQEMVGILEYMDGKPIEDEIKLMKNVYDILNTDRFEPNNITFTELVSSGNLDIISNNSIKNMLLELEYVYKEHHSYSDHERFDYEQYINRPILKTIDFTDMIPLYFWEKEKAKGIDLEAYKELL